MWRTIAPPRLFFSESPDSKQKPRAGAGPRNVETCGHSRNAKLAVAVGRGPGKLSYALLRLHVTLAFKIVHRRGADRAKNYLALIEHCELNDHSIEVVALHLAPL